ncbi:hypothetical protein P3T36_001196 [Kitasatospora sp. MAP12-15]|uniref:hypothetical protein n=1 Tax=unclassified Kitasatospora TaxID=2633591 RepID=UPI002474B0A7|nr:hypothetical protein [Kitasatospora sp. MAP12-44]MDH6114845.1 hypothetical protein [Kitasatospora sp. MAP12-44]
MTVHDLIAVLPAPAVLLERCRAFAVLDAVLDPHAPTHTFEPAWRDGVALATMENGSGDQYALAFDPAGVFLYGFDHECDATPWREQPRAHWPGLLDGLPASLARYAGEPAFQFDDFFDATVCAWRETGDTAWRCGAVVFEDGDSDGAEWLFDLLADGGAEAYAEYASAYFGRPIDRPAVASVLAGLPLAPQTVAALDPSADFAAVAAVATAIGFPVRTTTAAP